jgi:hypothetical protein
MSVKHPDQPDPSKYIPEFGPCFNPLKSTILPSNLYHYTSAEGIKGIIESESVWASNIRFLNDRCELVDAIDECVFALSEKAKKVTGKDKRILEIFSSELRNAS